MKRLKLRIKIYRCQRAVSKGNLLVLARLLNVPYSLLTIEEFAKSLEKALNGLFNEYIAEANK